VENVSTTKGVYNQLQSCLDKVVGKIGPERTAFLLESFLGKSSLSENESGKIKIVLEFLTGKAITVFELEEHLFYVCNIRDYRDARMCCFHLMRKYTSDTFSKIAHSFKCSEKVVSYGHHIAEERLELPKYNQGFVAKYTHLESDLIQFISKINQ
jgi:hypothetical protein